jgi:hypothetical protein
MLFATSECELKKDVQPEVWDAMVDATGLSTI